MSCAQYPSVVDECAATDVCFSSKFHIDPDLPTNFSLFGILSPNQPCPVHPPISCQIAQGHVPVKIKVVPSTGTSRFFCRLTVGSAVVPVATLVVVARVRLRWAPKLGVVHLGALVVEDPSILEGEHAGLAVNGLAAIRWWWWWRICGICTVGRAVSPIALGSSSLCS